jgi:hypothetical protein
MRGSRVAERVGLMSSVDLALVKVQLSPADF